MPDQEQRATKRLPQCVVPGIPDTCSIESKVTQAVSQCDPAPPAVCPPTGFSPPPIIIPPPDPGPGPLPSITISSLVLTAGCASAYPGPDMPGATNNGNNPCPSTPTNVIIPAGAYTTLVSLAVMTGLSEIDQTRINTIPSASIQALVSPSNVVASASYIQTLLGVTQAQSVLLNEALAVGVALVLSQAQVQLNSELSLACTWYNVAITAVCTAGSPPGSICPPGADYNVPCGQFSSNISQADADAQAQAFLAQTLQCCWTNAAQTVSCANQTAPICQNPNQVTVGDAPGFLASASSPGGSVTVAAGTFTSYVSQADANNQARLFAEASLVCVYTNCPAQATCSDPTQTNQSQVIPCGAVQSFVSAADAQSQAQTEANELINCPWCSAPIENGCLTQYVWYSPVQDTFAAEVTLNTNPTGDVCAARYSVPSLNASSVSFPACYCVSYTSQAEADACAEAAASATPSCQYGNIGIGARCATSAEGGLETTGCVSYSQRIDPDAFTAFTAVAACNAALSTSKIPSSQRSSYASLPWNTANYPVQPFNTSCCYQSVSTTATCAPDAYRAPSTTPYPTYTPDATYCPPIPIPSTASGGSTAKYTGDDAMFGLTLESRGQFVTSPAGAVTLCNTYTTNTSVYPCTQTQVAPDYTDTWRSGTCGTNIPIGMASQTQVNTLAENITMGALVCAFGNTAATVYCGFTVDSNGNVLDNGETGAAVYDPLSPGGTSDPIVVAADQFISYNSFADAQALRNGYMSTLTNCYWSNAHVLLACDNQTNIATFVGTAYPTTYWNGTITFGSGDIFTGQPVHHLSTTGNVPARIYQSYVSQTAANTAAQTEAAAQLDCYYGNAPITMQCDTSANVTTWQGATFSANNESTALALGTTKLDGTYPVFTESSGSAERPIAIATTTFRSTVSQYAANQSAIELGVALLNCYYVNPPVAVICGNFTQAYVQQTPSTFLNPYGTTPSGGTSYPYYVASAGYAPAPTRTAPGPYTTGTTTTFGFTAGVPTDSDAASQTFLIDGRTEGLPPVCSSNTDVSGTCIPYTTCSGDPSAPIRNTTLITEMAHQSQVAFTLPANTLQSTVSWVSVLESAIALAGGSVACNWTNGWMQCECSWNLVGPIAESGTIGTVSLPTGATFSTTAAAQAEAQGVILQEDNWNTAMAIANVNCTGEPIAPLYAAGSVTVVGSGSSPTNASQLIPQGVAVALDSSTLPKFVPSTLCYAIPSRIVPVWMAAGQAATPPPTDQTAIGGLTHPNAPTPPAARDDELSSYVVSNSALDEVGSPRGNDVWVTAPLAVDCCSTTPPGSASVIATTVWNYIFYRQICVRLMTDVADGVMDQPIADTPPWGSVPLLTPGAFNGDKGTAGVTGHAYGLSNLIGAPSVL